MGFDDSRRVRVRSQCFSLESDLFEMMLTMIPLNLCSPTASPSRRLSITARRSLLSFSPLPLRLYGLKPPVDEMDDVSVMGPGILLAFVYCCV